MRTNVVAAFGLVLSVGLLTGCSAGPTEPAAGDDRPSTSAAVVKVADVVLTEPATSAAQPKGVTYDTRLVPAGARLAVAATPDEGNTKVDLVVAGLLPNTKYGSHVHTKPCGGKPADSGPHYQHVTDPTSPSVDPVYANADNEVWLDFTTDAEGGGTASTTVRWVFRKGEANAVVLHAAHTSTAAGKAGTAGDRLACVTAAF